MNKTRIIKIIIIVCLVISIIIFNVFDIGSKGSKYDGVKGQRVDGLIFQKVDYMYDPSYGGNLVVNIINTTNKSLIIDGIKVISRDKKDKIIETLNTKIYLELEVDESIEYVFYSKNNIDINDYDLEYIPNIVD